MLGTIRRLSAAQIAALARDDYDRKLALANRAPRCAHIRTSGLQCGSPALRGRTHCFYHDRLYTDLPATALPALEDAEGIQHAIMHVTRLILERKLDNRTAALVLYALQTASANLKRMSRRPLPFEIVIDDLGTTIEREIEAAARSVPSRRKAPARAAANGG